MFKKNKCMSDERLVFVFNFYQSDVRKYCFTCKFGVNGVSVIRKHGF